MSQNHFSSPLISIIHSLQIHYCTFISCNAFFFNTSLFPINKKKKEDHWFLTNSMASSLSGLPLQHDQERPGLESIRAIVVSLNECILEFSSNSESWNSLKSLCDSRMDSYGRNAFFELSELSVVSNLYEGIEAIDAAMHAEFPEEKSDKLKEGERMLQVPALLDEDGLTADFQNRYLISCSYIYLAVVQRLRGDQFQAALHFLQALLVSPYTVCAELALELPRSIFSSCGFRNEIDVYEVIRRAARKYKHWLMYYQIMLHGDHCGSIQQPDEIQVAKPKASDKKLKNNPNTKRLQEVLLDSEPVTPTSVSSHYVEDEEPEEDTNHIAILSRAARESENDYHDAGFYDLNLEAFCFSLDSIREEVDEENLTNFCFGRFFEYVSDIDLSLLEMDYPTRAASQKQNLQNGTRGFNGFYVNAGEQNCEDLTQIPEECISNLRFEKGLLKFDESYAVEIKTIYETLSNKKGVKYTMLKEVILNQLITAISTATEESVVRASVSILAAIISISKSAVEDIKKKGLQLYQLATALKRNVPEAATLIYLINPSPTEIKTLDLLPSLVEIVCSSNTTYKLTIEAPIHLTPPVASVMIIEVLVTAFDCATNSMHLAAISSPHVLQKLLDVAKHYSRIEERISLANILTKCMQFVGQCREYVSQFVPVSTFTCLLQCNENRAKRAAVEFLHEILQMPRSPTIRLLQRVREEEGSKIMNPLMHCVKELDPSFQLFAANLLIQFDVLKNSPGTSVFIKEAVQIILKLMESTESFHIPQQSAFVLANIGGTYSWTGEPYTTAWLVKKAGLNSLKHRNVIRGFDWSDECLQDPGINSWSSKAAKSIIDTGKSLFYALEKGLRSKVKSISRDCLTATAWIGCEIAKCPESLKHSACDILLDAIGQFLHPGFDLEERLLACLCIYNYASGRGMQKLIHFSEGVRESLRRFSSVTWMAEELHRVADFYLPNKSRISCVHTQILEVNASTSGAVTALIYFRGFLLSGHFDGSIKVWDIKQHSANHVLDTREHRKAVTCFALIETGSNDGLLSASADKTIRIWHMVQRNLECLQVIALREPCRKLETYGQMVFVLTESFGLKVFDSTRRANQMFTTKKINCMSVIQGKVYLGCTDSTIQELSIINNREREVKGVTKGWMKQNKSINSIVAYRDWLYSASSLVEGSKLKDLRTNYTPQVSMMVDKSKNLLSMEVVEDFIYLNCYSSTNTLQIWLRGTQQKVGRISASSKITSILTINDIVLCGTEKGLIKGWIPL